MAWVYLVVAGLFEIAWAVGLKYTHGFTRLWPSVLTIGAIGISMGLLAVAVRTIPVGTGYAVWTGIGAVGTAVLGIILLSEGAATCTQSYGGCTARALVNAAQALIESATSRK